MVSESISAQLMEAATLMLVGMVVVFAFLTLLIGGVKLIAFVCAKFPESTPQETMSRGTSPQTVSAHNDNRIVAAITAAIAMHRQQNK